jgi:hypothetical protein
MTNETVPPPPPPPIVPRRGSARISRRNLLIGAGAVGLGAAALTTGLLYANGDIHTGPATRGMPAPSQNIAHLLRRAGFGALPGEIQHFSSLGYSGAVHELLNPQNVSDDLDQRLQSLNLDLTTIPGQQQWWILRMLYTKRPLQEKMTLFWHGLLTSSYEKVGGRKNFSYIINQNMFLRAHAFDTFDNILLGITLDPAMMWWLDLRLSKQNAPNENYARELMELFTLGVNGGYTQNDVHDAARALTGVILKNTGTVVFDPTQHDAGQKTLLGQTGNFDYRDVIRIVAAHPATGPHLSARLLQFFVNETPSNADVKTISDVYYSSGHNMQDVMRAVLTLPSFQAAASYRARLKSPAEYTIGAVRQLQVESQGQGLATAMGLMGQILLAPPNVAGWPGDESSSIWINTGTWITRVNLIESILQAGAQAIQGIISSNHLTTPDLVLTYFTTWLVDGQLSADRMQTLRTALTGGTTGATVNAAGVSAMLYLLMSGPEYMLN